jgi:SAM-dependent methyltransferase
MTPKINIGKKVDTYLNGEELYGDDFDDEELSRWYAEEEQGYFDLVNPQEQPDAGYDYGYSAFNDLHAFDYLGRRHFRRCLALGCARGDDVAPLADHVDKFIGIEPAERWWSDSIGGKPAVYKKPSLRGDIPLPDESVDLAVSLGVLHHIANASFVISEVARVLEPNGLFVVREPISWMGDWRQPRRGLTKNERGIPWRILEARFRENNLQIERRRFVMTNPLLKAAKLTGMQAPFSSRAFSYLDWAVSTALSFNDRYRRTSVLHKLAPGSAFYIVRKAEAQGSGS